MYWFGRATRSIVHVFLFTGLGLFFKGITTGVAMNILVKYSKIEIMEVRKSIAWARGPSQFGTGTGRRVMAWHVFVKDGDGAGRQTCAWPPRSQRKFEMENLLSGSASEKISFQYQSLPSTSFPKRRAHKKFTRGTNMEKKHRNGNGRAIVKEMDCRAPAFVAVNIFSHRRWAEDVRKWSGHWRRVSHSTHGRRSNCAACSTHTSKHRRQTPYLQQQPPTKRNFSRGHGEFVFILSQKLFCQHHFVVWVLRNLQQRCSGNDPKWCVESYLYYLGSGLQPVSPN